MFEQSKKSVLYIATLSALALMSGVASAATTGTITDQEGVNDLGLNGSKTENILWSNKGGTGFEPTSSLLIVGNKNDVTLSAKDVLKVTGAQNADNKVVAFYGMNNLTLAGSQHAVLLDTGNTKAFLGRNGFEGNDYLQNLTLKGGDEGHALYVKTGDKWEVVANPEDEMDAPKNKADVRFYAQKTTLETTGSTAVFIEGKWNAKEGKFDTHPDIEFCDVANVHQTLTMKGSEFSIDARNGASMTVRNEDVHLVGGVHVSKNAQVDIGYQNKKNFPSNWEDGFNIGDKEQEILDTVTVTANGGKAALEFDNGGLLSIGAKNVVVNAQNGVAVSVKTTGDSYKSDNSVVDLYGAESLTINGDIKIDTTEGVGKQGYINISGKKVVITGDIDLKTRTDNTQAVNIVLEGKDSSFTGTINTKIIEAPTRTVAFFTAQPQNLNGTNLSIRNGATFKATGDSSLTNIDADGGVIDVGEHKVRIDNLNTGNGGTTVNTTSVKDKQIEIGNNTGDGAIAVNADLTHGSFSGTDEELRAALNNMIWADKNSSTKDATIKATGLVSDMTVNKDLSDKTISSVQTTASDVVLSLTDIASNQMLAWRAQISDVSKRMGDLRTYDTMSGGWVRMFGSRSEYGDRNMDNKSTTIQVGTDRRVAGNGYVGLMAHYSEGDGDLVNGSTEDKAHGFGIYGGWMADDGQFVDVILKRTRMDTDYKLKYTTGTESNGNFHTWGTSLAMEYGWRLACDKTPFWIEPQAEVTYGHLEGVDYTTSAGVKAHQKGMDSLVGRLGLSVGYTKDANTVYAKASVAHEFEGESSATMRSGQSLTLEQDIGGTWGEVAVGGTVRLNKSIAAYGEFQTTFGSPVETPYQWNVGVRYLW